MISESKVIDSENVFIGESLYTLLGRIIPSSDRDAREDVFRLENQIITERLLSELIQCYYLGVEHVSTKNNSGPLSKNETSYQFLSRFKHILETKNKKELKNLKKKYNNRTVRIGNSDTRMQTSVSSYKPIHFTVPINRSGNPKFNDIFDAALCFSEYHISLVNGYHGTTDFSSMLQETIPQPTDSNVMFTGGAPMGLTYEKMCEAIDHYYFQDFYDKNKIIRLKKLYKEKYRLLYSVNIYNKIAEILDKYASSISVSLNKDFYGKVKKEVSAIRERIKEIENEMSEIFKYLANQKVEEEKRRKEFEEELRKSKSKKVPASETLSTQAVHSLRKKKTTKKKSTQEEIAELKELKEKLDDYTDMKEDVLESKEKEPVTSVVQDESPVQEVLPAYDRTQYEDYCAVRAKLDKMLENKNQYSSVDALRADIVRTFSTYGDNYFDIIDTIYSKRADLLVCQRANEIIEKANMFWYECVDSDPNLPNRFESNGLSAKENFIVSEIRHILMTDYTLPEEVRAELSYYVERHAKLENEIRLSLSARTSYSKDSWNKMLNDNRLRFYFNTRLLGMTGLSPSDLVSETTTSKTIV